MSQKLVTVAIVLTAVLTGCARAVDHIIADVISAPASDVAARHGADPMLGDPQTLMTRLTPQRRGDAIRAAQLAEIVRYSIARFRGVKAAQEAGYRSFPPEPPPDLRIVHYVHSSLSREEAKQLDPTQPGALLYERMKDGSLRLVGAMFTAPVNSPLDELDSRVPLSVTQWHLHQNVCIPKPVWSKEQWARTAPGGRPLFGPGSPVTTETACNKLGGRFLPTVFGWMAHVYVFAENRADLWNAMYGHSVHKPGSGAHRH